MNVSLATTDAVILCGGLGTRLQAIVPDCPKVLAPVQGRPFLDILLTHLDQKGFRRFILCVGHQKEEVKRHVADAYAKRNDLQIVFSEENESLGTGGALKRACGVVRSPHFLAMNGDTFCDLDFEALMRFHKKNNALLSMVLIPSEREDAGGVAMGEGQRVVDFQERAVSQRTSHINSGIYCMSQEMKNHFPAKDAFSLEYDFFPGLAASKKFFGFLSDTPAFDIGTPERYRRADEFFASWV